MIGREEATWRAETKEEGRRKEHFNTRGEGDRGIHKGEEKDIGG